MTDVLAGASAVEDILRQNANPKIRVFVVWEPILPTDYSSPGTLVLSRLSDTRATQYWDKNHLFAEQLGHKIDADPGQVHPNCCVHKGTQWDEVAVYSQGARWDEQMPRTAFLNGPVVRSLDFSNTVTDLLSK